MPYLVAGHALPGRRTPIRCRPRCAGAVRAHCAGAAGPARRAVLGPGLPHPAVRWRRLVLSPLFAARSGGGRLRPDQQSRSGWWWSSPGRTGTRHAAAGVRMSIVSWVTTPSLLSGRHAGRSSLVRSRRGGRDRDARELLAAQRPGYAFARARSTTSVPTRRRPSGPRISEPWSRRFGWDGRDESRPRSAIHCCQ